MNITKLTVTPIIPKTCKLEFNNPDTAVATTLIKERLFESAFCPSKSRKVKNLPDCLKNFVNPATWVSKFTDVSKGYKTL